MVFEIRANEGAGDLRFGMTRQEIRETIGRPFETFFKSSTSEMETDSFDNDSIHVFYKRPGLCEAIEFYPPANVSLHGRPLLGRPYDEIAGYLREIDPSAEEDDVSITSYQHGVGVYGPSTEVESVIAFEREYYNA
jgi:hypothetical protein